MQRLEHPLLSSYPGILSRRKSDFDYSNNPLLMYSHIQDVTAIMEKTVKNTGGVAALQKKRYFITYKKCQKSYFLLKTSLYIPKIVSQTNGLSNFSSLILSRPLVRSPHSITR